MPTITTAAIADGVATLVLDDTDSLTVGGSAHIYGTLNSSVDGLRRILTIDGDAITFSTRGDDEDTWSPVEGLVVLEVAWISDEQAALFLNIDLDVASESDTEYLAMCVEAANDYCFRARSAAGYTDRPDETPNVSTRNGCVLYAGALFRERGSLDSFSSFDALGGQLPTGAMGQIRRLLGVGRAAFG